MECKCGAATQEAHLEKVEQGYSAHAYTGSYYNAN